jgi:hypothetical protein
VGGAGAMSPCAGEHGVNNSVPVLDGQTLGAPLCKSHVDHQRCTSIVRLSLSCSEVYRTQCEDREVKKTRMKKKGRKKDRQKKRIKERSGEERDTRK